MALMSSGEFAHASGLSRKALRLYDELGLLTPVRVDPRSGYRFYAPAQLERERLLLKHERRETRRQEKELRRQSMRQLPAIIAVVIAVIVAGTVLRHIYSIWLVLAVLAFLWLYYSHRNRERDRDSSS